RRGIKFVLWGAISLATGITALAYFYPLEIWLADLAQGDISGAASAWLIIIAGLTFVNAGWLRESFCTHACPYSRFQSVMFDSYTQTVRYDEQRGEPRGKGNPESKLGDCVDCNLCVHVCPTNIDIRDGLQIACVDCGACIDACDQVMLKLGKPTGLITYEPELQRSTGQRWRLWGYGMAVCVTAVLTLFSTLNNDPLTASIQRDRL
ncbi:MAG: 4Fe-4S dicluster domain-containing protein, partial [Porticoccaceae bacterium]|nr:4Fe-4S dicluster domain-containing protein [Porticoccaceae bacterium]